MNRSIIAAALLGAAVAAPAHAVDLRTGLWEVTVKTEMPGMPMAMPSTTRRYCVRPQDLVPRNHLPGQHCKVLDQQVSAQRIAWRVQCTGNGGTATGTGEIRYSGNTYHGKMEMSMPGGPNGTMHVIQTMDGRRLGACK
jgi:hypothetical protein